jgi:hypothetical protein
MVDGLVAPVLELMRGAHAAAVIGVAGRHLASGPALTLL